MKFAGTPFPAAVKAEIHINGERLKVTSGRPWDTKIEVPKVKMVGIELRDGSKWLYWQSTGDWIAFGGPCNSSH